MGECGLDGVQYSGTDSWQPMSQKLLDLAKSYTPDPSLMMKLSTAQVLSLPHLLWTEILPSH